MKVYSEMDEAFTRHYRRNQLLSFTYIYWYSKTTLDYSNPRGRNSTKLLLQRDSC